MITSILLTLISAVFFCQGCEYKYNGHGIWLRADSSKKIDMVMSRVNCEAFCSKEKACTSVNFDMNDHECFLNYDLAVYATYQHKFEEKTCSVYSGAFPTPCDEVNCSGNGTCKETGKNTYKCECNEGYHGKDCELEDLCFFNRTENYKTFYTYQGYRNIPSLLEVKNCPIGDLSCCQKWCEELVDCRLAALDATGECYLFNSSRTDRRLSKPSYALHTVFFCYEAGNCSNVMEQTNPSPIFFFPKVIGFIPTKATDASTGLTECMKLCWRTEGCIVAQIHQTYYWMCFMYTEVVIGYPGAFANFVMAVMEDWADNVELLHNKTETVNKCDPML